MLFNTYVRFPISVSEQEIIDKPLLGKDNSIGGKVIDAKQIHALNGTMLFRITINVDADKYDNLIKNLYQKRGPYADRKRKELDSGL